LEDPVLTSRYGGWLCLDFANIVEGRNTPRPEEHLHTYQELVWWAADTGVLDGPRAARLRERAAADPGAAAQRLAAAIELREAVFRTFRAAATGVRPPDPDLATIQSRYADALRQGRLDWSGEQPRWIWPGDDLDQPAWAVAVSAVELATRGPLHRVKVCAADEGCAGLFVDTTKNNSRRWCDMAGCGNEVKFRRQTERRRAARRRSNAR
jgi:predicted RNA-binding Zn ribbon-like protein